MAAISSSTWVSPSVSEDPMGTAIWNRPMDPPTGQWGMTAGPPPPSSNWATSVPPPSGARAADPSWQQTNHVTQGTGWGAAPNPTGASAAGWNAPNPGAPANPQDSGTAWGVGADNTSPNSFSEVVRKKNALPPGAPAPHIVRPGMQAPGQGGAGWGVRPVDQDTPWGGSEGKGGPPGPQPVPTPAGGQWGAGPGPMPAAPTADGHSWGAPQPDPTGGQWGAPMAQQSRGGYEFTKPTTPSYGGAPPMHRGYGETGPNWDHGGMGPPAGYPHAAPAPGGPGGQWGGQGHRDHRDRDMDYEKQRGGWGGGGGGGPKGGDIFATGGGGPSWMDEGRANGGGDHANSLYWEDPSAPKKRQLPDKGLGTWGDPSKQGEIRRWKITTDVNGQPVEPPSDTGPSTWTDTPVAPRTPGATTAQTPMGAPPSGDSWNSAPAPTPVVTQSRSKSTGAHDPSGTSCWGDPKAASGGTPWGETPVVTSQSGTDWTGTPIGTPASGSAPGSRVVGPPGSKLASGDSGGDRSSTNDDVFIHGQSSSNPTTPVSTEPTGQVNGNGAGNLNGYRPITPGGPAPTGAVGNNQAAPGAGGQPIKLQMITQIIAERLRAAVHAGHISIDLLNRPLPSKTLLVLNQLLECMPKLEQAESELASLNEARNAGPLNTVQEAEAARINGEVNALRQQIADIKRYINATTNTNPATSMGGITGNGAGALLTPGLPDGSLPQAGPEAAGSKLSIWKTTCGSTTSGGDNKSNGNNGEKLSNGNLNVAMDNLNSISEVWSRGLTAAAGGAAGFAAPDWGEVGDSSSETITANTATQGQQGLMSNDALASAFNGLRMDGPQEFQPGKPWVPRQKEIDDNTTPSDLLSQRSLSIADPAIDPEQRLREQMANFMPFSANPPASANFRRDFRPSAMEMMMSRGGGMGGAGLRGMPPPGAGAPGSRVSARSFSTPQSAFAPYPTAPAQPAQWLILLNIVPHMEERAKQTCQMVGGQILSMLCLPGSGWMALRYKDANFDKLVPRLQADLGPYGITVNVGPDAEVDRLQRAHGMRSGNAAPPMGPPPPPMGAGWATTDGGWGLMPPMDMALPPFGAMAPPSDAPPMF